MLLQNHEQQGPDLTWGLQDPPRILLPPPDTNSHILDFISPELWAASDLRVYF